jgi:hypothetical protein
MWVPTLSPSACRVLWTRVGAHSARPRPGVLGMRESPPKSCGGNGLVTVRERPSVSGTCRMRNDMQDGSSRRRQLPLALTGFS